MESPAEESLPAGEGRIASARPLLPPIAADQALQHIGRSLSLRDWAFAALRFLTLRQGLLSAMDLLLPSGGRILDVGCGSGLYAAYFAQTAPARRIVGIDSQPSLLSRAERIADELGLRQNSYVLGDVAGSPLNEPFDAIYVIDTLHRLPLIDQEATLARLRDLLRPGGTLIIKEVTTASLFGPRLAAFIERTLNTYDHGSDAFAGAYRHHDDWLELLGRLGLRARLGHVPNLLQPHILITATRA